MTDPQLTDPQKTDPQKTDPQKTVAESITLDGMEQDALTELVNVGVSRAATSLRTMIGNQVLLSVPRVAIITRSEAPSMLGEDGASRFVAVCQQFEGDFSGRALLIFPETKSLELVRAVTGGGLPLDDVVALEQEALAETGNIILNSCLATIANMLRRTLRMSLPDIVRGGGAELFELSGATNAGDMVLVLYINFTVDTRDITGYITMLLDLPALRALKQLLTELVHRSDSEISGAGHVTD
jgi:chemotaxis protein CheC